MSDDCTCDQHSGHVVLSPGAHLAGCPVTREVELAFLRQWVDQGLQAQAAIDKLLGPPRFGENGWWKAVQEGRVQAKGRTDG